MNPLWSALSGLALAQGRRVSPRDLQAGCSVPDHELLPEVATHSLIGQGFSAQVQRTSLIPKSAASLPLLLQLQADCWAVWKAMDAQGQAQLALYRPQTGANLTAPEQVVWPLDQLQSSYAGLLISARLQETAIDQGVDASERAPAGHWFWQVFTRLRSYYGDCIVSAVLINLLALASSMFSMNVYDRVIPNGAIHSLWVLALGVFLAGVFELGLRTLRANVLDEAGKRADLALSAQIFRQVLNLKPQDRPGSSGQFASQLREFESVRDFVSSTTLVALTDLPFAFLFIGVIFYMGGSLAWITVAAACFIVLAGILAQLPIKKAVERYQYETTQKFAFMVETLERLETVEALGARASFQSRWERIAATTARSAMSSRFVSALTLNFTQFATQAAATALIVWGVYLILAGQLTTGALIGCSILAGRALAPLGQIAALMARWQTTRASFVAIDRIMHLPGGHDACRTYIHLKKAEAPLVLEQVQFSYPRSERVVLAIDKLTFQNAEITAVMGPVGSGKSSLLRLLAGLQLPSHGRLLLGGIDVRQISPADWRSQVCWVGQDAVLFRASLRENLLIAAPDVSEERFLHVLQLCGLDLLAAGHPMGLDMPLGDGGQALSGGQRQMVALGRALLSDAPIVLLDEPTSAFDIVGEKALLKRLHPELAGRMVVIATHRPAPVELAQRVLVLDHGKVLLDGPRDQVLQAIADGQVQRVATPAHLKQAA